MCAGPQAASPGTYLEVRGALEGLPAHAAAVDALLAVRLLAVVRQHRGRGEGAVALQALVRQALLLRLAAWGQGGDIGHLQESGSVVSRHRSQALSTHLHRSHALGRPPRKDRSDGTCPSAQVQAAQ